MSPRLTLPTDPCRALPSGPFSSGRGARETIAWRWRQRRALGQRGFTMVELLAVVAMVGILAAIALVGYRRYLNASKTADAKAVMSAIRIGQESHRAETLGYLDCSTSLTDWYPSAPNGKRKNFVNPSHSEHACWQMLNVTTDAPTTFGYAVVAGNPGAAPPVPSTSDAPTWPAPTTEPWYVIQAAGDQDGDGVLSLLLTSSFNGEIYVENEAE
ncbi:MAG: prepilin-type N-terminal cleavage/methylation domain-containing protein [Myxococcota bacterium]